MTLLRGALLYQALSLGLVGIWALFFPNHFYSSFPGFGMQWISADGAFNEHLVGDVGSLNLGIACATIYALISRNHGAATGSGIAALVYSTPHFFYHLHHIKTLPTVLEQGLNMALLGGNLIIAIIIMIKGLYDKKSLA